MKTAFLGLTALACIAPLSALAQQADLPPDAQVIAILDNHPTGAAAAAARVAAAMAQRDMLRRGPQEITLSGSLISRSVDREGRYNEIDVTIGRAIRLARARLIARQESWA